MLEYLCMETLWSQPGTRYKCKYDNGELVGSSFSAHSFAQLIVGYYLRSSTSPRHICIWKRIAQALRSFCRCLHYSRSILYATVEIVGVHTSFTKYSRWNCGPFRLTAFSLCSFNSKSAALSIGDVLFLLRLFFSLNFNFILLPEGCLKMNNESTVFEFKLISF